MKQQEANPGLEVTDSNNKSENRLFGDISAVQVIATALASVTSMLLSSYIGIAGSVIGVAVASIVSTLAASAYKKFLHDSAEKIKELPLPAIHDGATLPLLAKGKTGGEPDAGSNHLTAPLDNATEPGASPAIQELDDSQLSAALIAAAEGSDDATSAATEDKPQKETAPKADDHPRHDRKKIVCRLVIVCVTSALLAVAGTAVAINALTTGQGLGTKPDPIITLPVHSTESKATSSSTDQPTTTTNTTNQSATSNDETVTTNQDTANTEQPGDSSTNESAASNDEAVSTNQDTANTEQPVEDSTDSEQGT